MIEGASCKTTAGREEISITYESSEEGRDTAHLVIFNNCYRKEVLIIGETVKHTQTGSWKENIGTLRIGTKVGKAYRSTRSSVNGVTYSVLTGGDGVITICNDSLVADAEKTGKDSVCAYVPGDDTYYAKYDTIEITVTDDHIQYIVWDQKIRHLKIGDNDTTLTAYATSDVEECETNGKRPITYSIEGGGTSVVQIVDSCKLRINGAGTATILATSPRATDADGHTYMEAVGRKEVVVRDPSVPCTKDYLYNVNDSTTDLDRSTDLNNGETIKFKDYKKNTTFTSSTFDGIPGYVTMFYKTHDSGSGTMYVDQYVVDRWVLAKNIGTPPDADKCDSETDPYSCWTPDTIALNRAATQVRVRVERSGGKFYFGGIKVHRAQYFEIVESSVVKDTLVFSSYIGTPQAKDVKVRWSDSRGDIMLSVEEGAPFTFSEDALSADCNGIDTTDLRITFNTIVGQTDSCYHLVLTDGVTTKTVVLKATATMEEVTFGENGDWTDDHWSDTPSEYKAATIATGVNVTISSEVEVYSLAVESGATVKITKAGGLSIGAGGITGAGKNNITIEADSTAASKTVGKTGYLRISPEYKGELPTINMQLYSIGYYNPEEAHSATMQYVGVPVDRANYAAKTVFANSYLYSWNESTGNWVNNRNKVKLTPFTGYATTQKNYADGMSIHFSGQVLAPKDTTLTLHYTESSAFPGFNLLANSFAAPIDLSQLQASDFSAEVDPTIYLFNTGTKKQAKDIIDAKTVDVVAPGQYLAIPVGMASVLYGRDNYPIVIPSMQGFFLQTTGEATLTLNYSRLIWNADYDRHPNQPMRVSRRAQKDEETEDVTSNEPDITGFMKVTMRTATALDHLYIAEAEQFTTLYDRSFDAQKKESGDFNVFAVEEEDQLAIDATNSLIGTNIGVRTGEETAYTLIFTRLESAQDLALLDKEARQEIDINEGTEYLFFAAPNETITDRFEIVERYAHNITTGTDKTDTEVKAHKFVKDNSLYILMDGVLYDALGKRVR